MKLKILLIVLLLADTSYSFYQHYHMPLDGDMAEIILPSPEKGYYHVLKDPFGISVLKSHQRYSNPNRYFAHLTASGYFKNVPLWLQNIYSPIASIYLASGLAKILMQLVFILLLAYFISGISKISENKFLIAAVLVVSLFQSAGYNRYMGIIDQSIIYSFFYALPLALLMIFFIPFYKHIYFNKPFKPGIFQSIILFISIVFLAFNGPLIPGIVLIGSFLILYNKWLINYKSKSTKNFFPRSFQAIFDLPKTLSFFLILFSLLSLYSLYIGTFNDLNYGNYISVWERYSRVPLGIYYQFTSKLAFPLLFLAITLNSIIIKRSIKTLEGKKYLQVQKWLIAFCLMYILLLPLGGFRIYRENILRYDTIIPVTMVIIYLFGKSSYILVFNLNKKYKTYFIVAIAIIILIFTNSDTMDLSRYNFEVKELEKLSNSNEAINRIDNRYPLMTWENKSNYKDTELNAKLLYYWNVTDTVRMYYQE